LIEKCERIRSDATDHNGKRGMLRALDDVPLVAPIGVECERLGAHAVLSIKA